MLRVDEVHVSLVVLLQPVFRRRLKKTCKSCLSWPSSRGMKMIFQPKEMKILCFFSEPTWKVLTKKRRSKKLKTKFYAKRLSELSVSEQITLNF